MSPGPKWSQVTALFGGTFDPPHLGHREAVRGLFEVPRVQRVMILPAATPPLKQTTSASAEHRVAMAKLCFSATGSDPYYPSEVEMNLVEIERQKLRPNEPSYTYDTLVHLKRSLPQLAFVIGTDQLASLNRWYRFPEILNLCHWIILERKFSTSSTTASDALSQLTGSGLIHSQGDRLWKSNTGTWIQMVPTKAALISSTHIRETLARTGSPPEGALSIEVASYLKTHSLYGTGSS